jgi:hypothetical protein
MDTSEQERVTQRAVAVARLRDKIVANHAIAKKAGERLEAMVQEWMDDTNAKKARRMQDDLVLLEVARSLVLHSDEMRRPSTRTAVDLLHGDTLSLMGLPSGPLPEWMVSIFEKLGTLNEGLTFRTEEYFLKWLKLARNYGVDLAFESPVAAFASIRIARMREGGEPFDEEEIRDEYGPARFESAIAQPCYAFSMILSEMIKSGVDPAVDSRSWWDVAIAVVLALDPLVDPRPLGLGLLPPWDMGDEENTFNGREAVPVYIPDRVRWSEQGDDRLWVLVAKADAVLSAKGSDALSRLLPDEAIRAVQSVAAVQSMDEGAALERKIRGRLQGERAERALSALRLLLRVEEDFIPAAALNGMGLPSKTVFTAATGWGKECRGKRRGRLFYAKAALVNFVANDWEVQSARSEAV